LSACIQGVHRLEKRAKSRLAFTQCLLGSLAFGDVPKRKKNEPTAIANERTRVDQDDAPTHGPEFPLEFYGFEFTTLDQDRFERGP
jgi:hypothetical protein